MKTAGIIVLIMGLVMTLYTGFSFVTKEKVVDIGSIEVTKDKEHSANWPPYVGVGLILVGGVMVVAGRKKQTQS